MPAPQLFLSRRRMNSSLLSGWKRKREESSLLGVLSLGIVGGTNIRIIADGSDEEEAVASLVGLVQSGFAE